MSDVLGGIVANTRAEVERRRAAIPPGPLERGARERLADDPPRGFAAAVGGPRVSVIAEHKRRSPSAGAIRDGAALEQVVRAYARGGAAALSVLTDGPHFGGSLDDLRAARSACQLPVLRKDFIVDPWQLLESAAAGADAVLLIVAALAPSTLAQLHGEARALGLDVLVEVHDRPELERALALEPDLVGINNRDLRSFAVEPERTLELVGAIPAGPAVVSESGIRAPEQLEQLAAAGVDAVLVGEQLMRAEDPEEALRILRGGTGAPAGRVAERFSPPLSGA